MGLAVAILWGAALLAIVILLAAVFVSDRARKRSLSPSGDAPVQESREPVDTLLFYAQEDNRRRTADGLLAISVSAAAWRPEWEADLLRIEVRQVDEDGVMLPEDWGETTVLSAYTLRALRMTEIGSDIEVSHFPEPIQVAMGTVDKRVKGVLRCALRTGQKWVLPPRAEGAQPGDVEPGWAAMSVDQLGAVCLFRLAA